MGFYSGEADIAMRNSDEAVRVKKLPDFRIVKTSASEM
jgi:hypothetical protein